MTRKRIVIIGGGFGGMTAARFLRDAEVILIDRTNHHVFQPLLYQVATAALSPSDIAWPLRTLFRSQPNVRVVMDDVVAIDRIARVVRLRDSAPISFDALIVAPGSRHAYFGHDEWESFAPGLKTMTDAVQLRERTIPEEPWIFVIGDAAHCLGRDGKPLPGIAPVAMREGRYVADLLNQDLDPDQRPSFTYTDRGMLATIGRAQAVAQIGPIHTSGPLAWALWCIVHIFFLIGLRNRIRVMSEWTWYYLTFKPGARLLFEQPSGQRDMPIKDHVRDIAVENRSSSRRAA
ncbi:MAG: NADH dehydrogenase [Nitrospira sp.]|jgi:NADH dehydrogenase FAD-containing subunit|nr:MAG: NADH dehydrogenase [Nitrospira sp.]